jgi:hypothetical protein
MNVLGVREAIERITRVLMDSAKTGVGIPTALYPSIEALLDLLVHLPTILAYPFSPIWTILRGGVYAMAERGKPKSGMTKPLRS